MNIKQAESLSGVSKRNIRFYEQEGLIQPSRNQENDYREYSQEDINVLKLIRTLRMVDMPLEQIREVIQGHTKIQDAASIQKRKLILQAQQLETAIRFCEEFCSLSDIKNINIDDVLCRMDLPENKAGLFQQWVSDYKKLAKAQHEKVFTFIPDGAVTNSNEFTLALFEYANENDLNLVITKEGMYPEFTLDGIEYTAERNYTSVQRVPVAVIRCTAVHPEDFEPNISKGKRIIMKLLHFSCLPLFFILINLDVFTKMSWKELFNSWEGWVVLIALLIMISTGIYRFGVFFYNENGKKGAS